MLQKTVFTLCVLEDGTMLSGGGSEIRAWDTFNRYSPVKHRMVGLDHSNLYQLDILYMQNARFRDFLTCFKLRN